MGANLLELVIVQAWQGLRRHSLVALGAVLNIAISLNIMGGFFLLAANLEYMASGLARQATITLQLDDNVRADTILSRLKADGRIREVTFVSKDEALKEYARVVNLPYNDLRKSITNPLPDTIRFTVVDPENLSALADEARAIKGVNKVRFRQDVADKLLTVARTIKLAGLVAGGLMALAALLLVSTTIQLAVHARRRELRIMQLVGATNNFIRAPFLVEGSLEGLLGGLLAALTLLAGYSWIYARVGVTFAFIELVYNAQFLALVGIGLVMCGVVFGILGSLLGTRRYLRLV
jgi:cell division transport system permease protein